MQTVKDGQRQQQRTDFFDNRLVDSADKILQPHREATHRRIAEPNRVVVIAQAYD